MTSRTITLATYAIAAVALLVLIAVSWIWPRIVATVATVLDGAMQSRLARIVIIAFWWWLGWHFLVTPPLPR